ncbi:hypothetical protein B0T22DRAFT_29372 [Podospora appendiculata]|uniref:Uncharacterized protein n=1 Tax=Podospora appendiculata TaxID=314037 RepID=A0AAE0XG79_9PEZI|nr:hypothetical protein B0T22DRAFT_29372 [Podospora appendiculata]
MRKERPIDTAAPVSKVKHHRIPPLVGEKVSSSSRNQGSLENSQSISVRMPRILTSTLLLLLLLLLETLRCPPQCFHPLLHLYPNLHCSFPSERQRCQHIHTTSPPQSKPTSRFRQDPPHALPRVPRRKKTNIALRLPRRTPRQTTKPKSSTPPCNKSILVKRKKPAKEDKKNKEKMKSLYWRQSIKQQPENHVNVMSHAKLCLTLPPPFVFSVPPLPSASESSHQTTLFLPPALSRFS